jgi:hypothetical protein
VELHANVNSLIDRFTPETPGIEALDSGYKQLCDDDVAALDQIRKSANKNKLAFMS